MAPEQLCPKHWYWVRSEKGTLSPFRFHKVVSKNGVQAGEFFVGSMIQTFPLSRVVGPAKMPSSGD